ncbi:MAG: S41 family peptidase, partial [Terracidiphilus sp.]
SEIASEDALMKQFGLKVRDGSFLKGRPFQAPWTSHSLLVPWIWNHQPLVANFLGLHRVRADQLLADLDVLQPVMERAYGGWDSAAARGWDWNRWFADWRARLAAKGKSKLSFDDAFAPMDALFGFQRDNHTQIPLNRGKTSDGSQTALLANEPAAACVEIRAGGRTFPIDPRDAGQRARTAKLWKIGAKSFGPANYLSMPTSYGTPLEVRCGNAWITLQPVGVPTPSAWSLLVNRLWNRPRPDPVRIERLGDGVVYARLPSFYWKNYDSASRQGWAQRQPADRVLIVDLRDNEGGDGTYGTAALEGWIDENRLKGFQDFGSQLGNSCLLPALTWNRAVLDSPTIRPSQLKFLQLQLDRMAQPYPDGCPRSVNVIPPQWTYPQRRFDPKPGDLRIVALVNSGCGSDCEFITMQLASLPETIVVGVNTFGVGQFIQPGYSVLPHTGLGYRIAQGRSNHYGDDRSYDGYGLDVDVVLPDVDILKPEQLTELAEVVNKL